MFSPHDPGRPTVPSSAQDTGDAPTAPGVLPRLTPLAALGAAVVVAGVAVVVSPWAISATTCASELELTVTPVHGPAFSTLDGAAGESTAGEVAAVDGAAVDGAAVDGAAVDGAGAEGMYVAYAITNGGDAPLDDLWVEVEGSAEGAVSVGQVEPGATQVATFSLPVDGPRSVGEPFDVVLHAGQPALVVAGEAVAARDAVANETAGDAAGDEGATEGPDTELCRVSDELEDEAIQDDETAKDEAVQEEIAEGGTAEDATAEDVAVEEGAIEGDGAVEDAERATDSATAASNLRLAIESEVDEVDVGSTVTYGVSVTNDGDALLSEVALVPEAPSDAVVSAGEGCATDPAAPVDDGLVCQVGELEPGATVAVEFEVSVGIDAVGPLAVGVTGTATLEGDQQFASAGSELPIRRDVHLTVTADHEPHGVVAGSSGNTIELTVANTGVSIARGVRVTDPIDPRFVVTAVHCGDGGQTGAGGQNESVGQDVACVFDVLAQASATVTVTYDVPATVDTGRLDHTATVVDLVGSLHLVGTDCAAIGGTDASAAAIVDCTLPVLAPGITATLTVTYDVPVSTPSGTVLDTAAVSSDEAEAVMSEATIVIKGAKPEPVGQAPVVATAPERSGQATAPHSVPDPAPDLVLDAVADAVPSVEDQSAEVTPDAAAEPEAEPSTVVTGLVVAADGRPVSGALVTGVDAAGKLFATVVGIDGTFSFASTPAGPIAEGRMSISITADGFDPVSMSVAIVDGRPVDVDVEMATPPVPASGAAPLPVTGAGTLGLLEWTLVLVGIGVSAWVIARRWSAFGADHAPAPALGSGPLALAAGEPVRAATVVAEMDDGAEADAGAEEDDGADEFVIDLVAIEAAAEASSDADPVPGALVEAVA